MAAIEAAHFSSRLPQADGPHHYVIVPDEFPGTDTFKNSRSGRFIQTIPSGDQNRNSGGLAVINTPPYVDYKIQITTTGDYQLYLRGNDPHDNANSLYAQLLEVQTTAGGPGPDWFRYNFQPETGDFATTALNADDTSTANQGWMGNAGLESQSGGGGDVPAVWTISKAGTYTLRISQREAGCALDAVILQLANLPAPTNPGPAESALVSGFAIGIGPKTQIVTPGQTATFAAQGLAPPGATITYQWQQAAAGSTNFTAISGATSASYTTPATTEAMNGAQYRAVVTSGGVSLPSSTATLITDVFTQQPASVTVPANTPVSFSVASTNLTALGITPTIQWQRAPAGSSTFADIQGATSSTFKIPFAAASDSGGQFRAALSALGSQVKSSAATLTVTADVTPPTITDVKGSASQVFVTFDEPLDAASAANKANYSISGGVSITGATLTSLAGAAGIVQLDISGAAAGNSYTLTVAGVKDSSGNAMPATTRSFVAFHIFATFNDGNIPSGAATNGNANIHLSGSYDGSAFLELTPAQNSMEGSIVFPDVLNAPVTKFTATWKMFIGQGSGNAADGVSFVISPGLDDTATFGEEGTGTGIIFEFDTYNNGNDCTGAPEAPAISVKYGGNNECPIADPNTPGNLVVRTPPTFAKSTVVNDRWVDVFAQVTAEGKVTLIYDNVKYFDNVPIPGWVPLDIGSRPAFGGRTGGEHAAQWLDDVAILYNADLPLPPPPAPTIRGISLSSGQITILWTGNAKLQSADKVTGPYTDVTNAASPYQTAATGQAKFYRLAQQ